MTYAESDVPLSGLSERRAPMRFVMHVSFPPEKFNKALLDGSAAAKMGTILEATKPEAAYFTAVGGRRGGFLIVNMNETSEMPKLAEPWFLLFDASVEFFPTMTPADLQKADIDGVAKKWK
jgi:hypothetical protein